MFPHSEPSPRTKFEVLTWYKPPDSRSFNSLPFNTKYTVQYTILCMVTQTNKWKSTHANQWVPTRMNATIRTFIMHLGKRVMCLRFVPALTVPELLSPYVRELRKNNRGLSYQHRHRSIPVMNHDVLVEQKIDKTIVISWTKRVHQNIMIAQRIRRCHKFFGQRFRSSM